MKTKLFALVIFFLWVVPVFAQSVDTAWVRRYNGPENGTDDAYAIAVDVFGNVYVTGYSLGSGTYYDYATIKYYPNGDTAWVRRYSGTISSSSHDEAYALAIDDSDNVYVTGTSYVSGTHFDYATIKYYPNGDTAWVRRYNGPGNEEDMAYAMTVDDSGNVYVTGKSIQNTWPTLNYDYATIKYYSNGDTAWVRRYNGPGDCIDVARAIEVDGSGNVYVTGESYVDATYYDYATIKYYPNGDTAWVRRYDGDFAYAIAVDDSNNVYVTGYDGSMTDEDYVTLKYYPNGDTAWVRRYNGPGNFSDVAKVIAVDGSGNVYVTGYSDGSWPTYDDYATIKYYPNGDTAWVRRYDGYRSTDRANAIAVDGSGNIYVTGFSEGDGTYWDYATIKYGPNGNMLWVERLNGPPGNRPDEAYAIAVDDSNNVYVTGYNYNIGTDHDYTTIKYVQFLCGDTNKDGNVDVGDVVYMINYLFKNGPAPNPLQAGNVNLDVVVDVGDIVYLINYLFKGGPAPSC